MVLQEIAESSGLTISDLVRGMIAPLTVKAIATQKAKKIEALRATIVDRAMWLYNEVVVPLVERDIIDGVTLFSVSYVEYKESSQWNVDYHESREYYVEREDSKAVLKCLEERWVEAGSAVNTLSKRVYEVKDVRKVFEEAVRVLGINVLYYMTENLLNKLALELGRLRG